LCRDIYLAAPLHDVGKVAIPDNILLKPGKLTDEEMAVIRTHATIGERILADSSCELIRLGAQIAAGHHERWDGAGYPNALRADEIPVAARVVAVADVFDALTTRRPYKEPMPIEVARNYLVENKGRQFDPACVEAFLSRWDEVIEIATGQATTPFQRIEAPLAPSLESAVEQRPVDGCSAPVS
ncbi:MAG: HD domain-containing protein, partial [Bradyrhizobiaceae bacterium]